MTKVSDSELKAAFRYDPDTGEFFYAKNRRPNANKQAKAGRVGGRGYVYLSYRDESYLAHRVAMLIMEGQWPQKHVDHMNGDKTDNRWRNLRHASPSQNQCNRVSVATGESGIRGVYRAGEGRWRAQISWQNKIHYLGRFDTAEDARQARERATKELHGQFARIG